MIYLLLGDQMDKKDAMIAQIKASSPANQSAGFDMDNLDASQTDKDDIRKALLALPMAAPKRLVLITSIHKLKPTEAASLIQTLKDHHDDVDVILESALFELAAAFKPLFSLCQTKIFGQPPLKPFEITNHMQKNQLPQALLSLHHFLDEGMYPPNILGVLIWYWGKYGRQYGPLNFERGLKVLEGADTNIKRSRVKSAIALEKAIVAMVHLQSSR